MALVARPQNVVVSVSVIDFQCCLSDTEPMDQLGAPATHKLKMADFGWESDEGGSPQVLICSHDKTSHNT